MKRLDVLLAVLVIAALVLRIIFALLVTQLLQIIGLILVGGLLLLWVAWKMYRDIWNSNLPATAAPMKHH